ncbi:hypothetical protein MCY_01565 [Bartonella rattimassiliensis 15908]|uniref:Uncharacterized protein n=1 Tax=Bartonella rattimassiliensis 15908 TaxID=1094556 RepID=J0QJE7_9HYPH|nr:hypothetical protein MCY_01565 [Bartonella rattimassiliensis 15908]
MKVYWYSFILTILFLYFSRPPRIARKRIERTYGDKLKYKMYHVISDSLFTVSFGFFTAMILQSPTAITFLVGSFIESGFVFRLAKLKL